MMKALLKVGLAVLLQLQAVCAVWACQNGASSTNTTKVTAGATVVVTPGYVPSNIADQLFNFSVTVTNSSSSSCTFVLSVQRTTLPASMTNGANTLSYVIERSGGGSIMHTGGTTTAGTSTASATLASSASTTINLRVRLPAGQSTANASGTYSDASPLIEVWQLNGSGVPTTLRSSVPMSITNTRLGSCTITDAANTSQTISVGSTGLTTGMANVAPSFNVTCSGASNVSLTSQNGAVTRGNVLEGSLAIVSGFRSKIEYSASINGGAGTVTLDTASATSATGVFNAAAVSALGTQVTITPESSIVPLLAGTYRDVLTISIVPQ